MGSKKRFIKENIQNYRDNVFTILNNKYFNIFVKEFKIEGIEAEKNHFIFKEFWATGTVACFMDKYTEDLHFVPYAPIRYNIYEFPEECNLINLKGVSFIPNKIMYVDRDVVLGWVQPNRKPIRMIVESYIEKITNVEMVINTNLHLQKIPFLYAVNPPDKAKAKDTVDKILNDEPVIFMDFDELQNVQALTTEAPYIIDKLYQYKTSLENELLTFLGVDNLMDDPTKDRLLVDQVNANNQIINANRKVFLDNIEIFVKKINEIFNKNLTVKSLYGEEVHSIHEDKPADELDEEGEENV